MCFQMAAAERKDGGYKVHVIKEGYSYTADNGRKTLLTTLLQYSMVL